MTTGASTKTEDGAREWAIGEAGDHVERLRYWATDRLLSLPGLNDTARTVTLGAGYHNTIVLDDPTGRVSRSHAEIVRHHNAWLLRDSKSKNGIRIDGAHCKEFLLEPGAEVGIGSLTLIAESRRSIGLRSFLSRLLGWRSERLEVVDRALRAVRMAAQRRSVLVLCGDGDLVPMACSIHRHALGSDRPFIVCDPRRRPGKATVRSAANFDHGMQALAAARGGTLCVRAYRLPKDFAQVVEAVRDPQSRTQLVMCAASPEDYAHEMAAPINVPPLATRDDEIDQIIMEYADDAIRDLGTPRTGFLAVDRAWVRMYSAKTLPDIEKGTLRLVAIRQSRNLSNAAERLGMAPVSLSRWIGRRTLPMQVEP
ncbi:MAG TPA: FHA domain-containing protein [Kofleriaceae bacterium]|nr:FHA domain-containing protein [Kofleriaceae bacterium]